MRRIGLGEVRGRGVAAVALAVLVAVASLLGQLGRPPPQAGAAVLAGASAPAAFVRGGAPARAARDALPGAADAPAPGTTAASAPAAVVPGPVGERAGIRPGWPGQRSWVPVPPLLAVLAAAALLVPPARRGITAAAVVARAHPFRGGARPARAPPVPAGC
ncbi:hypothetical protein [Pseudonocardia acidicola]|uniref:Uncharacterized protein n=1 Tax=Pseudonocardia acidicola TaxID=2724939 RepID=A0ABX1S9B0_9PSEU|nr:hypothetical protein [Pseudonocardia acidicola]NMH98155.1 hypothetical protein [Pseudonocardia acidicola]